MTERPLRVLLVLGISTGGIGMHVRSLASGLVESGHQVVVAGPANTEAVFDFTAAGARFVDAEIGETPSARDLAVARVVSRWVKGADVVHAHGFRAGLVALGAGAGKGWPVAGVRAQNVPLVVTWHNQVLAGGLRGRMMHSVEGMVARGATLSLGASADLVERATAAGGVAEIGEVAAPVPARATREVDEMRRSLGLLGDPMVLAVGRLHSQKDYPTLVVAMALLQERHPRPVLVVAGDGPDMEALGLLAAEQRVDARFLGRRDDVADLLAAADLLALSSVWEARALVIQEAMQVGLPVVATAVGGIPDLVAGDGLLVPARNPEAMAQAIGAVLDDPAGAAARAADGMRRAATWPRERDVVDHVADVYRRLRAAPIR